MSLFSGLSVSRPANVVIGILNILKCSPLQAAHYMLHQYGEVCLCLHAVFLLEPLSVAHLALSVQQLYLRLIKATLCVVKPRSSFVI